MADFLIFSDEEKWGGGEGKNYVKILKVLLVFKNFPNNSGHKMCGQFLVGPPPSCGQSATLPLVVYIRPLIL